MINTEPTTVRSIRQLSKRLGRSHVAVAAWRKREDWPFGPAGPWDVEAVRAWAARHLGQDNAAQWREAQQTGANGNGHRPPAELPAAVVDVGSTPDDSRAEPADDMNAAVAKLGPERAAKLRLTLERIASEKAKREIISGKYMEAAEVEAGRVARVHVARTALLQAVQRSRGEFMAELAAELPGLDDAECSRAADVHSRKFEGAIRAALKELSGDA